ncbi:MAG: amino acid ABC transporter substrate-binding protein [Gammaproteobacteria bacterium]|nr:MAG: amino acid ABC transporter substrate-binding protein [Gammaproteobacteria bacterium]
MTRFYALCLIALGLPAAANAADLTGTLQRVATTGVFRIGYVPDAAPLSFAQTDGNPNGYSIALCKAVAAAARDAAGIESVEIRYVPLVSPEDRISAVENGAVDIECGATTVTLSRRERVDFSLFTFITGGAVLSKKTHPLPSIENLSGQTIAVIKGTTTDVELRNFIANNDYKITLRIIETHDAGMHLLNENKVDGYASDRAMLLGQVFRSADRSQYTLTRDVFSFEPYALMLPRGDTEFRLVVDRALAKLYRGARIRRIYHDWIGRFGEPMTPVLHAMYEFQAVAD